MFIFPSGLPQRISVREEPLGSSVLLDHASPPPPPPLSPASSQTGRERRRQRQGPRLKKHKLASRPRGRDPINEHLTLTKWRRMCNVCPSARLCGDVARSSVSCREERTPRRCSHLGHFLFRYLKCTAAPMIKMQINSIRGGFQRVFLEDTVAKLKIVRKRPRGEKMLNSCRR